MRRSSAHKTETPAFAALANAEFCHATGKKPGNCRALYTLKCALGQQKPADDAAVFAQSGRNDIIIHAGQNARMLHIPLEQGGCARANQREEMNLPHNAAAKHNTFRGNAKNRVGAHLRKVFRFQNPRRMVFRQKGSLFRPPRLNGRPEARPSRQPLW